MIHLQVPFEFFRHKSLQRSNLDGVRNALPRGPFISCHLLFPPLQGRAQIALATPGRTNDTPEQMPLLGSCGWIIPL
eukprot:6492427-Amphidinium_carterae.2